MRRIAALFILTLCACSQPSSVVLGELAVTTPKGLRGKVKKEGPGYHVKFQSRGKVPVTCQFIVAERESPEAAKQNVAEFTKVWRSHEPPTYVQTNIGQLEGFKLEVSIARAISLTGSHGRWHVMINADNGHDRPPQEYEACLAAIRSLRPAPKS